MEPTVTESSSTFFGKSGAITSGELVPTEEVLCPLCGIAPQPFAVDYQGFTLCRCKNCSLEFVSPRLSFEELADKVYSDNYFPKRPGESRLTPEAVRYYKGQIEQFERFLPESKRVLDIGCGDGGFLEFARGEGWEIAGTDIHLAPDARDMDCPLWEGRLQDIDFAGQQFDLVRLNHVLEHTQNPLRELQICRDLVAPGGVLFVSVPNIAGISPRIKSFQSRFHLKSHRWRHYAAMHHLFFFSPMTLRELAERAGFRVLGWSTPVQKKGGQNAMIEAFYRLLLERTHAASILDLYCTPEKNI